jgi:hypothetical protein
MLAEMQEGDVVDLGAALPAVGEDEPYLEGGRMVRMCAWEHAWERATALHY